MAQSEGDRPNEPDNSTRAVAQRFIDAFTQKDAGAIPDLVAADCVMEAMQPAPDGERLEGLEANVRFWQAMVSDSSGSFEVAPFGSALRCGMPRPFSVGTESWQGEFSGQSWGQQGSS